MQLLSSACSSPAGSANHRTRFSPLNPNNRMSIGASALPDAEVSGWLQPELALGVLGLSRSLVTRALDLDLLTATSFCLTFA